MARETYVKETRTSGDLRKRRPEKRRPENLRKGDLRKGDLKKLRPEKMET